MDELKLPIPKDLHPEPKVLSMDEYAKFVEWNLVHTVDRVSDRKRRESERVNVMFALKA